MRLKLRLMKLSIFYYLLGYFFLNTPLILIIHVLILGCDVISYVNEAKEMLDKALNFQAIFSTVSEAVIVCSSVCFIYYHYHYYFCFLSYHISGGTNTND